MASLVRFVLAAAAIAGVTAAPANPGAADAPNFELGRRSALAARQDYDQDYETTGTVDYTSSSDGYSVTFSSAADFVVGKGWETGTNRTISFSGSTTASDGTVLLAVYGWSTNPLIEYYIQEYSNGAGAASGTEIGTYTSDCSEYTIYKHQQVDQPSIEADSSTFYQYISVRKSQRSVSGTVTVANHVAAWAANGMDLGTMSYQVLATEGWGSASGSSDYTISAS